MSPFDHNLTNHQKTPQDLHGRRPKSIEDWTSNTSVAMQDMPLSSSDKPDKQESSNSSISESQFDTLMAEYAAVREKMEKIEDKTAELYYARQPNGDTASFMSSDSNTSKSQKHSSDKGKSTVGKRQQSSTTGSHDHKDFLHANRDEDKAKNRKVKRPKTEEEKNRHINKVFIRENP